MQPAGPCVKRQRGGCGCAHGFLGRQDRAVKGRARRTAACLVITGEIESKCASIPLLQLRSPQADSLSADIRRCAVGLLEGAVAASWLAGAQSKHQCAILGLPRPLTGAMTTAGTSCAPAGYTTAHDVTTRTTPGSMPVMQTGLISALLRGRHHARNFGVLGTSIAPGSLFRTRSRT